MSTEHRSQPSIPESTYPALERPEFKSQIPPHLLAEASDADKHIMGELSKLGQFSHWSVDAHISTMESVRKTNGRLIRAEEKIKDLEDDRKSFVRGWKLIVTIGVIIGSFVGFVSTLLNILSAMFGPK